MVNINAVENEQQGQNLAGTNILCVDDSADCLELLRLTLTYEGAHVTTCNSAEDAIATLAKKEFDVVISDLSMPPGLDGYDLVHALREMEDQDPSRAATPSIAVSGDALQTSRKRRSADFQVYMPKPVEIKRLVYLLERLMEADGEAVKNGSLDIWFAKKAMTAAALATGVAKTATAAAANATSAAEKAFTAAAWAEKKAKGAAAEAQREFNARVPSRR